MRRRIRAWIKIPWRRKGTGYTVAMKQLVLLPVMLLLMLPAMPQVMPPMKLLLMAAFGDRKAKADHRA